eukprot:CAMPEP_0174840594 /NCGR_PEP_ID=MMETSP1114-20130205/8780_1 /TAXON_ID=312471 /ORGANISM="Neobodo designis, Strain CCAP 1951/1" /LENGTH=68 /DNA_ID=CAMNT_0016074749 /DNA_START=85 /DNA_END=288 /DNA_ORIENTATION=-
MAMSDGMTTTNSGPCSAPFTLARASSPLTDAPAATMTEMRTKFCMKRGRADCSYPTLRLSVIGGPSSS